MNYVGGKMMFKIFLTLFATCQVACSKPKMFMPSYCNNQDTLKAMAILNICGGSDNFSQCINERYDSIKKAALIWHELMCN